VTELQARALTAHIVAAYVENNAVPTADLPDLIASVSGTIERLGYAPRAKKPKLKPAVDPKRSVLSDHIVCLEDGKKFMTLTKHLRVSHGMTPGEYRSKWDLPWDYPIVHPAFAAVRSTLAKASGFGRKPRAKGTRRATQKQAV
jgi:predicted transcriptional regulator